MMNKDTHMKIEQFTRTNLAALRSELDSALSEIAKKHGITLQAGSIRFSAGEAKIGVVARVTESRIISDAFIEHMKLYGLKANVEINGKTLVRYDRKKIKYPFIYKDKSGKMFKCSRDLAKVFFG
jgi:hypothetical protein